MMDNMKEFLIGAAYVGVLIPIIYIAIELLNKAVGVGL